VKTSPIGQFDLILVDMRQGVVIDLAEDAAVTRYIKLVDGDDD
jgi:hypothetical protein